MQALQELGIEERPIIGLAKKLEEVFIPGVSSPQNISKSSAGLKLLQQIRDESHRFAINYHRKLRDKRALRSPLDDIPGIGPKRKMILLKAFRSVNRLREASVNNIVEKAKVPKKVAIAVQKHLQG